MRIFGFTLQIHGRCWMGSFAASPFGEMNLRRNLGAFAHRAHSAKHVLKTLPCEPIRQGLFSIWQCYFSMVCCAPLNGLCDLFSCELIRRSDFFIFLLRAHSANSIIREHLRKVAQFFWFEPIRQRWMSSNRKDWAPAGRNTSHGGNGYCSSNRVP